MGVYVIGALVVAFFAPLLLGSVSVPAEYDWRTINILTVLTGAAGFFIIAGEAIRLIPRNILPVREEQARNQLRLFKRTWPVLKKEMCVEATRSEFSPPEEDLAQFRAACPWATKFVETIERLQVEQLPEITLEPLPDGLTHEYIRLRAGEIAADVAQYMELRRNVLALRAKLEPSVLEELAVVLGPFFAAVAFGLAWLKALWGPI